MEAQAWAAIVLLAATLVGALFYLGNRIDSVGANLSNRIDSMGASLDSRIDSMGASLDSRIDSMGASLDNRTPWERGLTPELTDFLGASMA